jgi:hypothetical protein
MALQYLDAKQPRYKPIPLHFQTCGSHAIENALTGTCEQRVAFSLHYNGETTNWKDCLHVLTLLCFLIFKIHTLCALNIFTALNL